MNMDYESEPFARHHHQLSEDIHGLFRSLLAGFAVLQRRRFAAPWRARQHRAR